MGDSMGQVAAERVDRQRLQLLGWDRCLYCVTFQLFVYERYICLGVGRRGGAWRKGRGAQCGPGA